MKKPIIGISSGISSEMASSEYFSYTYCRINMDYTNSVINAGGIPVILPITSDEKVIEEQVKILDGLILSGGPDPNPLLFNEEPAEKLGTISTERDDFEMKLINAANKHKKPILCICRGIQIINIFFGGTFYIKTYLMQKEHNLSTPSQQVWVPLLTQLILKKALSYMMF